MEKSKTKSIPKFGSLNELVAFFETHDMGEYWDQMPEAHFDIDIKKGRTSFLSTKTWQKRSPKLPERSGSPPLHLSMNG